MNSRTHVDEPPKENVALSQCQIMYDVDVLWLYWWEESEKGWVCEKDELQMN